jgi:hypothetical protein
MIHGTLPSQIITHQKKSNKLEDDKTPPILVTTSTNMLNISMPKNPYLSDPVSFYVLIRVSVPFSILGTGIGT